MLYYPEKDLRYFRTLVVFRHSPSMGAEAGTHRPAGCEWLELQKFTARPRYKTVIIVPTIHKHTSNYNRDSKNNQHHQK